MAKRKKPRFFCWKVNKSVQSVSHKSKEKIYNFIIYNKNQFSYSSLVEHHTISQQFPNCVLKKILLWQISTSAKQSYKFQALLFHMNTVPKLHIAIFRDVLQQNSAYISYLTI